MTRLIVRYRGTTHPLAWLVDDERGRMLHAPQTGNELPKATQEQAREIVVLLPGGAIGVGEAKVAARNRDQLARAVPFALEDVLAEPVESLHFAWTPLGDGQLVAWIRRDLLTEWIADLRARGVVADALVPETLALPHFPDAATLLLEDDRALVRIGAARAFAVSRNELATFTARIDAPRDAEGRLTTEVLDATAASDVPLLSHGERHIERGHAVGFLARGARTATLPNFATGAFAAGHRGDGARRLWRSAAMLAAAFVLLGTALVLTEWAMLRNRHAGLRTEMAAVYRQSFPNATRVIDPRAQMAGELRTAGGNADRGGALPLLARIAPVLTQGTQYTLRSIEYRNRVLELSISTSAVATLDQLREGVATLPDIDVALVNATTTQAGAEGRLRIVERPRAAAVKS